MRFLVKLFGFALMALIGGFFVFVATLPRADSFDTATTSDFFSDLDRDEVGIVVPTGGAGARIARAIELYTANEADRILISGTHPDVRLQDLAARFDADTLTCCVDLGTRAQTTIGNAIEIRDWVEAHGYKGVYLVTHYYHLPRTTMELRDAAPDLVVVGVPVESQTVTNAWYKSADSWVLLGKEYLKYLTTVARTVV